MSKTCAQCFNRLRSLSITKTINFNISLYVRCVMCTLIHCSCNVRIWYVDTPGEYSSKRSYPLVSKIVKHFCNTIHSTLYHSLQCACVSFIASHTEDIIEFHLRLNTGMDRLLTSKFNYSLWSKNYCQIDI